MKRTKLSLKIYAPWASSCSLLIGINSVTCVNNSDPNTESKKVKILFLLQKFTRNIFAFYRVGLFGIAALMGDRFHPKLNILERPIAKKYCEGKVKRTLKRELKVLEIVEREANIISNYDIFFQYCISNFWIFK